MTNRLNGLEEVTHKQNSFRDVNHHSAFSSLATVVKVAIVGLGLAHGAVQAATIEVNSSLDDGTDCTLRDAIRSVNAGDERGGCDNIGAAFGSDDTINFATSLAGDTITLENGQLAINTGATLSIDASAVGGVAIDAGGRSRVFNITSAHVVINNLSIHGGGNNTEGGAFRVTDSSSLDLSNSTISGNTALNGAGIFVSNLSSATIRNSTISNNFSRQNTGVAVEDSSLVNIIGTRITNNIDNNPGFGSDPDALRIRSSSSAIVSDSVISNNIRGINAVDAVLVSINDSVITFNSNSGIDSRDSQRVEIINSTVSNNSNLFANFPFSCGVTATVNRRGIDLPDPPNSELEIINSSVSNNTCLGAAGVRVLGVALNIADTTIANNESSGFDAGIIVTSGTLTLTNSTISGNSSRFVRVIAGGPVDTEDGLSLSRLFGSTSSNTTTITNSTFVAGTGTSTDTIGAISSSFEMNNSIVVGGLRNSPNCLDSNIGSENIITSDDCGTAARAADPLLLPLADNGCEVMHATPNGPACVMTHALAASSPAIDTAIDPTVDTDQIGTPRPQGVASDVGAFEVPSLIPPPTSPGFTVSAPIVTEGDDISVFFTITLDEPQPFGQFYSFRTESGTAIDGEDYTGRVGRVFFPAGATERRRQITILDDTVLNEEDETFDVVVTSFDNTAATVTTPITIRDIPATDSVPVLSVARAAAPEGRGRGLAVIRLSAPTTNTVVFNYRTFVPPGQNNPATEGVDFVPRSGRIVFQPGQTLAFRSVTFIDDDEVEANEAFRFGLSDARNADIEPESLNQRMFILNDD